MLTLSRNHAALTQPFSIPHLGDMLSLFVFASNDNDYDIQQESGFSVYRLPATEGVFAGYDTIYSVAGSGWHAVSQRQVTFEVEPRTFCAS